MVDALDSINDALYRLGYQNATDAELPNAWVTYAELYAFADDAAKHLSVAGGIFIGLDASVPVTAGVGVYSEPSNHVFTLFAWVAPLPLVGGSNQMLRPTPVNNLWALDATWPTTVGESNRFSLDAGSVGTITIYPIPVNSGRLNQICQQFPATVAAGASELAEMPSVLGDYLTYSMLAGARGKESDEAMPEMAAHFKKRLDLYDAILEHLYGPGQ